jgi:cytochrome c biogenesis protein
LRFGVDGPVAAAASTLRISVARAGSPRIVDLQPGETAEADGLRISLESYFPDFALDKNQQPYTRSDEPRNPAALLQVTRGGEHWRVFVIQAMPGIHRPQGLDHVLSLTEVVSRRALRIRVSRQPAAPLALAGVLVSVLGLAWPFRAA